MIENISSLQMSRISDVEDVVVPLYKRTIQRRHFNKRQLTSEESHRTTLCWRAGDGRFGRPSSVVRGLLGVMCSRLFCRRLQIYRPKVVVEQERRNRPDVDLVPVPDEMKSQVFSGNNASAFDLVYGAGRCSGRTS